VKRIPPSRKLKQAIDQMLEGDETELHPLDVLAKLGARYVLQVALEQEAEDFLGREHY
jgi:hypothetical protein